MVGLVPTLPRTIAGNAAFAPLLEAVAQGAIPTGDYPVLVQDTISGEAEMLTMRVEISTTGQITISFV